MVRLNGKYGVIYGTILPDTIKHQNSVGQYVQGEVLTIKQSPFFENSIESAMSTVEMLLNIDSVGRVVWINIIDTTNGEVVENVFIHGVVDMMELA